MNPMYKELLEDILKIKDKVEYKLDDNLPDIYAYVANYAENFGYEYGIRIDSYDFKHMINSSFLALNNDFLQELDYITNMMVNALIQKLKNDEDIEVDLFKVKEEILKSAQDNFKIVLNKGIGNFEENFYYDYTRRIPNSEIRQLGRILTEKLEDEIATLNTTIARTIDSNFNEVQEFYQSIKQTQVNKNKPNEIAQLLEDFYRQNEREIEENPNVKNAFINLQNFCNLLISNGITPDNINEYDRRKLELLTNKVKFNIEEVKSQTVQIPKTKPKHMKSAIEESKPDGVMIFPKHFAQKQKSKSENMASYVKNLGNLTEEQKRELIDYLSDNLDVSQEEKPKTI